MKNFWLDKKSAKTAECKTNRSIGYDKEQLVEEASQDLYCFEKEVMRFYGMK